MASKMTSKKRVKRSAAAEDGVEPFLAALEHPSKPEILALRQIILGADPSITEGIKWNAPSFRSSEYFATFQLRAKEGVQIILHMGAKQRSAGAPELAVADPTSLLEWLATDRASVKFRDLEDIGRKRSAFVKVIQEWIKRV